MSQADLTSSDPCSFSRPDLVLVTNIHLSMDVNFDKKILNGNIDLTIKKVVENVGQVVLDVNNLKINKIYEGETKKILNYSISKPNGEFGSKLSIDLLQKDSNSSTITIEYETNPNARGLQWVAPEQTTGKVHPFLFSQFQPISARSVIPCQDTPSVKTKYSAVISAPINLTVLMSAICVRKDILQGKTCFYFKQDVPVPSSLIAIAVGALEYRVIGPRSKIWSEKEIIEASKYEFANTEDQLRIAEIICGPYAWGVYDLLVLPPSFPLGGMENPCLTFITPTVLESAGDRSLANVIAHEIAHSWTGNLVTNSNFEHFWLNEGFTMFVERKILGRLQNKEIQDFHAFGGLVELKETINRLGHDNPLTKLVIDLKGMHPDDAYNEVPYEKGYAFLRYLEDVVGGPDQFEPFLRQYIDTFKFQSITTNDFKFFFELHFTKCETIKDIDWNTWLYKTGMPTIVPEFDMTLVTMCTTLKQRFLDWNLNSPMPFTTKDVDFIIPEQIIQFLQLLLQEEPQPIVKLSALEVLFKFNEATNSEIKFRWLRIGLKAHWEEKINPALQWVTEVGRLKFIRPLYRDLYKWEISRHRAIEVYNTNKQNLMRVCAYTVAQDLYLV